MSNNKELDDILSSMAETRKQIDDLLNAPTEIIPKTVQPEPVIEDTIEEIEEPKLVEQPKIHFKSATSTETEEAKEKRRKRKQNVIIERIPKKPKDDKHLEKGTVIKIIVIVSLVLALAGGIFGIYEAKVGYVKPYEAKYNIEYPKGIQRKYCDKYGIDHSFAGVLTTGDTENKVDVASANSIINAYLERGSTVMSEQQFRAIFVSSKDMDLEQIYATPDGFLNASQEVKFSTLFGEEGYKVIACYYTNEGTDDIDKYRFPFNIYGDLTQRGFAEFQDKIESRRLYDTGYKFNYFDKFLTISTDTDFMEGYRFVILCASVDGKVKKSTTAEPNNKVHYPQSYYTKHKEHNPYQFAPQWYPEILSDGEGARLTAESF